MELLTPSQQSNLFDQSKEEKPNECNSITVNSQNSEEDSEGSVGGQNDAISQVVKTTANGTS